MDDPAGQHRRHWRHRAGHRCRCRLAKQTLLPDRHPMKFPLSLTLCAFAFAALAATFSPARAETPSVAPSPLFPHPDRIRYDGHCLQIEGRDFFLSSASFHYFRTPPELWRDRFQKIKDAGFNTVETYVPWNWH